MTRAKQEMNEEQVIAQLKKALEGVQAAADEVVRVSEAAQAAAAVEFVQSYKDEGMELMRLLDAADREDEEDIVAEELEKAGKMPPG